MLKSLDLHSLLLQQAVRKPYGLTPVTSDLYQDKSEYSIWSWELVCPSIHLNQSLAFKSQELRTIQHLKSKVFVTLNKLFT